MNEQTQSTPNSVLTFTDIRGQQKQMRESKVKPGTYNHTADSNYFVNGKMEVIYHPIAKAVKRTIHELNKSKS